MKLVSVNIEGSKHLDKIIPFLQKENPDVVCFQEIAQNNVSTFESALKMQSVFVGVGYNLVLHQGGLIGIAIFAKNQFTNIRHDYYVGDANYIPDCLKDFDPVRNHDACNRLVLSAEVLINEKLYCVATTHGTWTTEGQSTVAQQKDFDEIIRILDSLRAFIFAGDLNAPRGNASFDKLAKKYIDNIPKEYVTSLDQNLHRVPGLQYMVDGLFTTPKYKAENVKLVSGVSDHMAIVAEITIL